MSDKKQFTIVMLIASFFVAWIVYSNMSIIFINDIVLEDKELRDYPYPFRILKQDADTAVMGTLRSAHIPASTALKLLFPELRDEADNGKAMQYAQKEMARLQAKAKGIVLANSEFKHVRWEIDENWFRVQGIKPAK